LTKEKSKSEAVDLDGWGNWNSPTQFLVSSEDQVSISKSRYADSEQGRDEFDEQCVDAMIDPELVEDSLFNLDEPCFLPTLTTEPKLKTAYKGPSQNQSRRPYCVNLSLSEGRVQSMLHGEILPGTTMLGIAIAEEAGSDHFQGLEARGRHACKQNKKRKSSTDEKAKRRVLYSTRKQRSSHNAIEKRYRNNLNSKIVALQKVIPSLQEAPSHEQVGDDAKYTKDKPTHKYRKAAILAQAIEYIAYLEGSTERLSRETSILKAQVIAFKKQLVKLDSIAEGSIEYSQVPTGEILKTIQKSA
jgi:hypothetical protein